MAHYQKALELNPNHAEAHNNLGALLAQLGRTDEAMSHYRKALEINPNDNGAHNNLGVLLAQLGRSDEAIAHYHKALEINPDEIRTLKNLASALEQKGQWTDAASVLQNGLASAKSAGDEERIKMIEQILTKHYEAFNASQITSKTRTQ
jgi:superkiller protein 3